MVLQKHKISQNILQDIRAGPTPDPVPKPRVLDGFQHFFEIPRGVYPREV
jgi:hypothetical protein